MKQRTTVKDQKGDHGGVMDDGNYMPDGENLPDFRKFPLPPPGFDPRQASDRELIEYGLPPRPDPVTHPTLAARWERIAARRHEFVTPELRPLPIRRHVDRELIERRAVRESEIERYFEKMLEGGRQDLLFDVTKLATPHAQVDDLRVDVAGLWRRVPETSSNWSGAYVGRPVQPLDPRIRVGPEIVSVSGEWRIPGVNPPVQPGGGYMDGTYLCMVWVGIDGTSGSSDVLQAGTGSQCVVSGGKFTSTRFFTWIEWFSLPWQEVTTFPVSVGDRIACTVCAPLQRGDSSGAALFNNLTTGQTTSIPIDPPGGTSPLSGNVAEWIVEDPSQSSGAPFPFPNYGGMTFTGCTAGTKRAELNAWDGTEIDMVQGGATLSTGLIQGKQTVFCHYGP